MSSDAILIYSTFLAILSLVALASAIGLLSYRAFAGPGAAGLFSGSAIWVAGVVALVATIGSLIFSEVIHFVPCRLCWFQRIAMYPLAVILPIAAIRREAQVKWYALPFALAGLATSVYHYLLQTFPSLEGGSCDPLNPCSAKYVDIFGFISIPFMAGTGFIVIAVLLGFYVKTNTDFEEAGAEGE